MIHAVEICLAPKVQLEQRILSLCGPLDGSMAAQAQAYKVDQYDAVTITSQGGFAVNAFALVREFNASKKPVTIKDYCFSACADIVFMTSKSLSVSSGAVVAFHRTSSFMYDSYVHDGGDKPAPDIAAQAEAEHEAYKAGGLPIEFLYKVAYATGIVCVDWKQNMPGDVIAYHTIDWVIPDRNEVETVRGHFSGYWPHSLDEVKADSIYPQIFRPTEKTVFGLRPEGFKFAPLCSTLREQDAK